MTTRTSHPGIRFANAILNTFRWNLTVRTALILAALVLTSASFAIAAPAATQNAAGDVVVVAVNIRPQGHDRYSFDVTLRHDDTGWDHYANLWEVLAPDGTVLGKRVLLHPHVGEQPFTRSLSGVLIPPSITEVFIRASDNEHGASAQTLRVKVPRP